MATTAPTRPATPGTGDPRDDARAVGLRYVSDDRPGITRRRAGRGFTYRSGRRRSATRAAVAHRARSRSRRRGRTCGSARTRAGTSRRPAATRGAASSTATTRRGAPRATRRSSTACSRSPTRCRSPRADRATISPCAACRARRCSPRSSRLHRRRRSSASATRSTRAQTSRSALTTLRDEHARIVGGELRLRSGASRGKEHEARSTTRGSRGSCSAARSCPARSSSTTWTTTGDAARRSTRAT